MGTNKISPHLEIYKKAFTLKKQAVNSKEQIQHEKQLRVATINFVKNSHLMIKLAKENPLISKVIQAHKKRQKNIGRLGAQAVMPLFYQLIMNKRQNKKTLPLFI